MTYKGDEKLELKDYISLMLKYAKSTNYEEN